eukprot:1040059-Pelagomonas_calceolata.AAC.14
MGAEFEAKDEQALTGASFSGNKCWSGAWCDVLLNAGMQSHDGGVKPCFVQYFISVQTAYIAENVLPGFFL